MRSSVRQLFATNQAVDAVSTGLDNLGQSVATSLGGTSLYNPATDTVTAGLAVGATTYTNVQDALTAVNATASAGWHITDGASDRQHRPERDADGGAARCQHQRGL